MEKKGDLNKLTKNYFIEELGLNDEAVPEAARNLLGVFEVLLRIDERLNQKQL